MNARIDELVASIRSRETGKDPTTNAFRESGKRTANVCYDHIAELLGTSHKLDILDFGAGCGRVVIPLAKLLPNCDFLGADVDAEAIEYLGLVAPTNVTSKVVDYNPPLPFSPAVFDCVYAISVWSHFPEALAMKWLGEVRRIVKPDGLVMISTGSRETLIRWMKASGRWAADALAEFDSGRLVHRTFTGINNADAKFPGIAGMGQWGDTAIHPDYIKREWAKLFEIVDIQDGILASQTLVTLRRPRQ